MTEQAESKGPETMITSHIGDTQGRLWHTVAAPRHGSGKGGAARGLFHHLSIWFRVARPYSLSASVIPVVVGTALAAHEGAMDPILFVLTLLGSVLIQVGANLTDEYCDHSRGSGGLKFAAPHKVIQGGLLSPQAVLRGAFLCFGGGSLIGLYLAAVAGWPLLAIGIVSVLAAYFHSAGPRPLGSIGLGELTVFFFMGPLTVGATYFVQVGQFSANALWTSLPVGFLVAAILLANNIRDIDEDRALRKATLATMLGGEVASHVYYALLFGSFLASVILVFWGLAPLWVLAVFLCLPKAFSLARLVAQSAERSSLHRALRGTASLHLQFGMLLVASLVVSQLVDAW